jgi:hypothetical protein
LWMSGERECDTGQPIRPATTKGRWFMFCGFSGIWEQAMGAF